MKWCKENINGGIHTLEFPPTNKRRDDGSWIINYNLNEVELIKDGYSQWTNQQIQNWRQQYGLTKKDYDDVLEQHLDQQLINRGYTKRSPIEYTRSKNQRWSSDANDWAKHLDQVMEYRIRNRK